jgi:hypothetical protein
MYKNFNLTDEERKEIMEMHKSHGYKKPLNELDDKDIDIIRGKATQKWSRAGKQFQQDFEDDFADPAEEPVPYWEKDKPRPSGDFLYDIPSISDIERKKMFGKTDQENAMSQAREERIKLSRRIASLVSHKEEFGGDDELDNLIRRLRAQAMDMDDSRQSSNDMDKSI